MTEDKYKRFRHLERPRQQGAPEPRDPTPGTGERFEALEERRAPAASGAGVASGHLDRFRPAAERPMELVTAPEGELPFVRCASCQMDHNRTAIFCANCGADLRTEEQRAFNAQLAVERRAQATVEQAQAAELERGRQQADAELARQRREMGESLAREVGDAERRRLDSQGLGGFGSPPRGGWGWGWGSGWGDEGWGGGWGWSRHRHGGFGLVGWLVAALLRLIFGGRWR